MPTLDVSELNIVLSILVPAVVVGVILGPIAAKFLDAERWGSAAPDQQGAITLVLHALPHRSLSSHLAGNCSSCDRCSTCHSRLPAAGQVPAEDMDADADLFDSSHDNHEAVYDGLHPYDCPKAHSALVIGSCVTCTDPILSQAIAKGPFADKYVPRPLREIISSEAGANDGFGFPFLMLAVYLIRFATPGAIHRALLHVRQEDVGRLGGGIGLALGTWIVETWLYIVLLSVVYGAVVGYASGKAVKYALRKEWIDTKSYLLWPTGLGLFLVGTCGAIGTDDLLACFVAGNALNWDGQYLAETEALHDEVNSCMDVLLNFGAFMYIGAIMPFSDFHQPDTTGLTIPRLVAFMPSCIKSWKEALFMGYFGPIGRGSHRDPRPVKQHVASQELARKPEPEVSPGTQSLLSYAENDLFAGYTGYYDFH
ncbi:hypothetical protein O988_04396 [Pseudogymnoascus sp. VKM F-3808]|nr:hypothetical protein O988_04396 [Pseudogymnoascus sp. VKM F-3808]